MLRRRIRSVVPILLLATWIAAPASRAEEESFDLGALEDSGEEARPAEDEEGEQDFDVVEQLEAGSGIRVSTICTNCNAASLSVNGMSGDHVGVSMDGIPSAGGLNAVYWLTQFPSEFIGYTGVKRGPGSVLSGSEAFAGTIEFHQPDLDRRRQLLQFEGGSWDWLQLKGAMTDQWGPVGALLFVQAADQDVVDANGDSFNEVAAFERQTYDLTLKFDLTDYQTLTLKSSYYDEDQVDGPGAPFERNGEPFYVDEDAFFNWRTFAAKWQLALPSGFRVTWHGRFSKRNQSQWSVTTPPLEGEEQDDSLQIKTYDISDELSNTRLTFERPAGAAGYLTWGLGWDLQRLRVLQPNDRFQAYWIVDAMEQTEAFLQYDRSVGSRWDYSVGLRYDAFDVFGKNERQLFGDPEPIKEIDEERSYSYVSPRFQAHYRPNGKVVLGLAAGRGILGPKPSFAETCCGAKYQRNLDLVPERAWSYQFQAEFKPTPDQRFTATAFWTDFTNYHEKVVYRTQSNIPYYSQRALDEARVRGLDFVHDMRFKGDRFNVGWTFTWNDADGSYRYDDGTTSWRVDGVRYVPETAASAYFRYSNPRRGTTISASLNYQGSLTHFRLGGFRAESDPWEFLESESFTTADVSFEQRVGSTPWSVYGGVSNIGDYYMPDLGELDSAYDWGPITGRFLYAGVKFLR